MYLNRGPLLNFILKLKKLNNFLNKHFYVLIIISTISKYTNTKFYKVFSFLIKLIVLANILLGVSIIIYFSYTEGSFTNGLSIYYDYVKYYLDIVINFWNDLIKLDLEDKYINNNKQIKDVNLQFKQGMKEAIKEVIDETIDRIHEEEANTIDNTTIIKNIIICSSVLLLGYVVLILPGSGISPEDLTQYNWFNKSLIEFKLNIFNLFTNPTNPGNPGTGNTGVSSPISPTSPNSGTLSDYFPKSEASPVISESSSSIGQSTITPNTPIIKHTNLSPLTVDSSTQTISDSFAPQPATLNSSTQTYIDGITVSKMLETTNLLQDVLDKESSDMILNHVDSQIKNIKD